MLLGLATAGGSAWYAGVPPQNLKTIIPFRSAGNFNSTCACHSVCVEIKGSEESVKQEGDRTNWMRRFSKETRGGQKLLHYYNNVVE